MVSCASLTNFRFINVVHSSLERLNTSSRALFGVWDGTELAWWREASAVSPSPHQLSLPDQLIFPLPAHSISILWMFLIMEFHFHSTCTITHSFHSTYTVTSSLHSTSTITPLLTPHALLPTLLPRYRRVYFASPTVRSYPTHSFSTFLSLHRLENSRPLTGISFRDSNFSLLCRVVLNRSLCITGIACFMR